MAGADTGGISSVVLNYYSHMDREKIHFDIAITTKDDGIHGQMLRDLGATFYRLPLKSLNLKEFKTDLKSLLLNGKYDAIHVHENNTSWYALRIAKLCGVKIRYAHSHTAGPKIESVRSRIKQTLGHVLNDYYSTRMIACGQKSGDFVFGKSNMSREKSIILPNAIDTSKYTFDYSIRKKKRVELRLKDEDFVVGMVCRVAPEKNTVRAIELFQAIKAAHNKAIMVIAGDGEHMDITKAKVEELGLHDSVCFLGNRSDVYQLLQAYDVFLMPSLYEGFPVAAIEALATGLPVLMSDVITPELNFASAAKYLPINDTNAWVEAALQFTTDNQRMNRVGEVKAAGFDIHDTAKQLQDLYLTDALLG